MDIPLALQIVEIIVATAALCYGIFEHIERQKLADVLKAFTQAAPGDVAKIEESCKWAWVSARDALIEAAKVPDSQEKKDLLRLINQASSHAEASQKMCVPLFNQLLTLQQAQFKTRAIVHPHKDILELCIAESKNAI